MRVQLLFILQMMKWKLRDAKHLPKVTYTVGKPQSQEMNLAIWLFRLLNELLYYIVTR